MEGASGRLHHKGQQREHEALTFCLLPSYRKSASTGYGVTLVQADSALFSASDLFREFPRILAFSSCSGVFGRYFCRDSVPRMPLGPEFAEELDLTPREYLRHTSLQEEMFRLRLGLVWLVSSGKVAT